MRKASLAAALAASLSLSSVYPCLATEGVPVDEARVAEEQLLGAADEVMRFLGLQPFIRSVTTSAAVDLDLPAATMSAAPVESMPVDEVRVAEEQLPGAAVDPDVPAAIAATAVIEGVSVSEARVAKEQLLDVDDEVARFLSLQPFTQEVRASTVVDLDVPAAPVMAAVESTPVDEARVAEEQLLGAADDEARFLSLQPFTREVAASAVVKTSLDQALTDLGVPAATMLEALRAFTATVNLKRDVKPGDRLYVRYEQGFTAEGTPIGVGHVMWAELTLASRGPVAVHRFRTRDKVERLWFTNGLSATPPALRMPLDTISVSSGFGLRADPFDQPPPLAATGKPAPMGGPLRNKPLPPGLPTGSPSGNAGTINLTNPLGASLGFVPYAGFGSTAPPKATTAPRAALFMHEGIDLVAPAGTPVYAAADGVVVGAAPNGRYGNWIRIEHGGNLATVYGHLMAFAPGIEPGESVVRGELIGFVGSTGRSTGAHLHFEVLDNGKPVNPITHPELKAVQLRGGDMDNFRKQVARSLEERTRESKVIQAPLPR